MVFLMSYGRLRARFHLGFESSSTASLSGVFYLQRIVGMQFVAGMMFSTWSVL